MPFEVAPNTLLAARVTEYKPASVRPLAEVSASIQQKLEKLAGGRNGSTARQEADGAIAARRESRCQLEGGANVLRAVSVPVSSLELVQAVFRADTSKLPAYVGVNGPNGYLLARIDAVKETASVDEGKLSRLCATDSPDYR